VKDRLLEALKQSTADYAEIRFESEDATQIVFRGPEVDRVSSSRLAGGIVRACTKGGWGLAVFDDPGDLARQVAEACECAALVGREKTQLAEVAPVDRDVPAKLERDFRGVSFDEKLGLVKRYNEILLEADPAIETSHAGYLDSFRTVHFASSRGTYFREERPQATIHFVAVARDGSLVQRASDGVRSTVSYDALTGLEGLVETTARRAAALLKAPPCPSCHKRTPRNPNDAHTTCIHCGETVVGWPPSAPE